MSKIARNLTLSFVNKNIRGKIVDKGKRKRVVCDIIVFDYWGGYGFI